MRRSSLTWVCLLLLAAPAWAHDYWLQPWSLGARLVYGHAGESEEYKSSVLKSFRAYDRSGKALSGEPAWVNGVHRLHVSGAEVYTSVVDDGPWVKTVRGWRRGTRNEHGRVLKATHDRYYAKLVKGEDIKTGLPLEILVESGQGSRLSGRVLFQGQPLANVALESDHKTLGKTDSQGRFSLAVPAGKWKVLRVAHQVESPEDSGVDVLQHIMTLTLSGDS